MIIRTLLPLVLAISWTGAADARMYRWVDENGTTVYSQSPPASGEAAEVKINTSTPRKQPATDVATQSGDSSRESAEKQANGPARRRSPNPTS